MAIERLNQYRSSKDGIHWYDCPTRNDIIEKINEIIDYINNNEACYEINPLEGILDGSNNT